MVGRGWLACILWASAAFNSAHVNARVVYDNEGLSVSGIRVLMRENAGSVLPLSETKSLDVEEAAIVASHAAGLDLRGLTALNVEVAKELSKNKAFLRLDGLREAEPEVAEALATTRAILSLTGLQEITSVPLAAKLARQGGAVDLPEVRSLPTEVAGVLAQASSLNLSGLESLSHKMIGERLQASHGSLILRNLSSITSAGAEGLVARPLNLHLQSLKELPPDVAIVFSSHDGGLDLDRLKDISPDSLGMLFNNQGPLDLGAIGLRSFGEPTIPDKTLRALAKHSWPITLSGLDRLTRELAGAIRDRTSVTTLSGIQTLHPEVAEELINCKGYIWLTGLSVRENQEAVVRVLLRHQAQPGTGFILPSDMLNSLPDRLQEACNKSDGVYFGNTVGK